MALEPSSIQRDRMLAHGKTKLILVQFLVMKDMGSDQDYLNITNQAVQKEGGTREHQLKIDQVMSCPTIILMWTDSLPANPCYWPTKIPGGSGRIPSLKFTL